MEPLRAHRPACVLLADQNHAMLRSLKGVLEPEFEVAGMADNALSFLDALHAHRPPLVVVDLSLPWQGSFSLARHLSSRYPELRIVVVGLEADPGVAREVLEAGCAAYVVAAEAAEELPRAARAALSGETFTSAAVEGEAEST